MVCAGGVSAVSSDAAARRARLDGILRGLPIEDALFLSQLTEPPALRLRRRLDARDEAVRELASLLDDAPMSIARTVASTLERYLSAAWHRERGLQDLDHGCSRQRLLCHRIARLNGGDGIGISQIRNILAGHRGDYAAQKSAVESARCPAEHAHERGE